MKKSVKAGAVVTKRGKFFAAFRTRRYATAANFHLSETVLPCTTTYDLPKKRAKKP